MPCSVTLLSDNLVKLSLPTSSSSVTVHLFGATIISWSSHGVERLFLSQRSNLDGSSAIRGGIPIIFPVFGEIKDHQGSGRFPKDRGLERLPRHGFVRDCWWKLGSDKVDRVQEQQQEEVSAEFILSSTTHPAHFSTYKFPFTLIYTVTLTGSSLLTSLKVIHDLPPPSPSPQVDVASKTMPFQALLHSYLHVPSSPSISISGLKNHCYLDKTCSDPRQVNVFKQEELHTGSQEIDRVFLGPQEKEKEMNSEKRETEKMPIIYLSYNNKNDQSESQYEGEEADGLKTQSASNDNDENDQMKNLDSGLEITRSNFPHTTIWNPGPEKSDSMKDMHPNGWRQFVCVEPGHVDGWVHLDQGQSWQASIKLQVVL